MDTNTNHLNMRKECMNLIYHDFSTFDFLEEVRKFHKECEQEEKEHDQH